MVILIAAANDLALPLDRELIALDANKRDDLARSGPPQPGFATEEAEATLEVNRVTLLRAVPSLATIG